MYKFNKLLIRGLGILIFLLQAQAIKAQEVPLSLSTRVENAGFIIEGKVVSKVSYWNETNSRIFTANEVVIYKDFKRNANVEKIIVITDGGIVGNNMEQVSHSLQLKIGDTGLFFLNNAKMEKRILDQTMSNTLQFSPVAATQSLVKYNLTKNQALDFGRSYNNIYSEFYPQVFNLTNKNYREMKKLPSPKTVLEENTKSVLAIPEIHCFSPDIAGAGAQATVTIQGVNFGTQGSNSKVELAFESNNWGLSPIDEDYIVEWTNTQIQIIIPLGAGSGNIRVTNNNNESVTSNDVLTINFSRGMVAQEGEQLAEIMLGSLGSNNSGYPLKYSTSTSNGGVNFNTSSAKTAFERALSTVQKKYGFNFFKSNTTTTINEAAKDGENVVTFDNNANSIDPLAITTGQFIRCSVSDKWELVEFDIVFNNNLPNSPNGTEVTWNYEIDDPDVYQFDFESVALHELGHAGQLKHVNEIDAVMYPSLNNGHKKRDALECYGIQGAQLVNNQSLNYTTVCADVGTYSLHSNFEGYPDYNNCSVPNQCPICEPPTAGFYYATSNDPQINFVANANNAIDYNWVINGIPSILQNPSYDFPENGVYNVCLTVSNDCGEDEFCRDVVITGHPASCQTAYTLTGIQNTSDAYEAASYITSSQVVSVGTNVSYDAGDYIVLLNGFLGREGSTVCAFIDGCDNNGARLGEEAVELEDIGEIKAFPNPLSDRTNIMYSLNGETEVSIMVFSPTGQLLETLLDRELQSEGTHTVNFDASHLPSGTYYYQVRTGYKTYTNKLILIQ